jgi:hypothetical protein
MSLPSELLKLFDVNNSWGIQESTLWAGDAFFPKNFFGGGMKGVWGLNSSDLCKSKE